MVPIGQYRRRLPSLAILSAPPYVSPADGCESGFAAFGHPATAKNPGSGNGTDIAGRQRSVRYGAKALKAERSQPFKDIQKKAGFLPVQTRWRRRNRGGASQCSRSVQVEG